MVKAFIPVGRGFTVQLANTDRRIETCLQRFRSRRRIQDKIAKYFNEYLFLGGIDCSQRAFQGGSGYDFEDTTNAEERELTAVDTLVSTGNPIYYNASDPTHWEVDFTGVVAGYLSRGLHSMAWGRFEDVTLAIGVITNFLRYVLMHNVCPEYEDDINKAIGICKLAEEDEIPRINTINSLLPGQFALACQELYFRDIHPIFYSSSKAGFTRPENFDANGLFVAAIVLAGTPEMVQKMKETKTIRITDEEDQNLEVMSIQRPTPEVSDLFRRMLPAEGDAHFAPIGTVTCKNIRVESEYDLGAVKLQMPLGGDETLFMDDEILKKLKPGLQLTGTLCTLNIGAKFFRDSPWVSPSYYTFLPQEMMKGYKAPVPNLREAPSALNHEGDDDGGGELSCE